MEEGIHFIGDRAKRSLLTALVEQEPSVWSCIKANFRDLSNGCDSLEAKPAEHERLRAWTVAKRRQGLFADEGSRELCRQLLALLPRPAPLVDESEGKEEEQPPPLLSLEEQGGSLVEEDDDKPLILVRGDRPPPMTRE